jgi:hypothetical protein
MSDVALFANKAYILTLLIYSIGNIVPTFDISASNAHSTYVSKYQT